MNFKRMFLFVFEGIILYFCFCFLLKIFKDKFRSYYEMLYRIYLGYIIEVFSKNFNLCYVYFLKVVYIFYY